jgi:ABC-type transport system involved in cytochrome c biogenesis permease component
MGGRIMHEDWLVMVLVGIVLFIIFYVFLNLPVYDWHVQ